MTMKASRVFGRVEQSMQGRWRYPAIVGALGFLFLCLRVPLLSRDTWYDEAGLVVNATRGFDYLQEGYDWLQYAPAGYMAMLSLAYELVGSDALLLARSFSLLSGCLTFALVALLGVQLNMRWLALLFLAWMSLAPLVTEYQTLAKPYALDLALAALWATLLHRRNYVALTALAVVGPFFSYGFGFFAIWLMAILFTVRRLPRTRATVIPTGTVAVFTAISYLAFSSASREAIQEANSGTIRSAMGQLTYGWPVLDSGFFPWSTALSPEGWSWLVLVGFGTILLVAAGIFSLTPVRWAALAGAGGLLVFAALTASSLTTRAFLPVFAVLVGFMIYGLVVRFATRSGLLATAIAFVLVGGLAISQIAFQLNSARTISETWTTATGQLRGGQIYADLGIAPALEWVSLSTPSPQPIEQDTLLWDGPALVSCRGAALEAGDVLIVPRVEGALRTLERVGQVSQPNARTYVVAVDTRTQLRALTDSSLCTYPKRNPSRSWSDGQS